MSSVQLDDVSKWYGPVMGLNGVRLEFRPGLTGLVGPNGAGKSTLMRLITGHVCPSVGTVRVFQKVVWGQPAARRRIGYSPQGNPMPNEMTGKQFVRAGARLSGLSWRQARRRTREVLEITGMAANAHKRIGACSKGMRQRLKLAQCLVHDPDVLVLDEPLNGIDPTGRREMRELFERLCDAGKTVIVSSHILHELDEIADRLVLMAQGRVLATGTLAEIRGVLAEFPLTVRLQVADVRRAAGLFVARPEVVAVTLGKEQQRRREAVLQRDSETPGAKATEAGTSGAGSLTLKLREPEVFFAEFPRLVVEGAVTPESVQIVDSTAEAVFAYLLRKATPGTSEPWE